MNQQNRAIISNHQLKCFLVKQQQIHIDDLTIHVIRSPRRKTIALQIKNGEVLLRLPSFASIDEAKPFIHAKANWIKQKLSLLPEVTTSKTYQNGELFYYQGEQFPLVLIEADHSAVLKLENKQIQFYGRINRLSSNGIQKHLANWYRQQAQDHLNQRTQQLATQTGLQPKSVEIKTYKARWGSCKVTGEIQLNWKLLMAPPAVIDYVIIHELCHLKQHNHSPAFWQLVELFDPHYKTHRRWLKEHGYNFHF